MEQIKLLSLLCIVLGIVQIIEAAPLDNDDLYGEDLDELKRFAIPWLDENHDIDTRGKELTPEFKEEVNASFAFSNLDENFNSERELEEYEDEQLDLQARGSSRAVRQWTVYLPDGKPYTDDIQNLCMKPHNYFRKKHQNMPTFKYDRKLAADAERYSLKLADENKFEHDKTIGGKQGENLYRMDNTYDLIATPIHAIMAWYVESWVPLKGGPKDYNYQWNPRSAHEFHEAGVGHFTQMMWNDSLSIGCGAATTTFNDNGRKWTRTVITTRYVKAGNWLGVFPKHVFPLKKGRTLEGKVKRGKLYPPKTKCVTTMPKKTCEQWKGYKWCDKEFAKRDCYCTCVKDKKG